jgi:putative DNA primase/helicase
MHSKQAPSSSPQNPNGQRNSPPGAGERLAQFVEQCGGAIRQAGKETICRCPAHPDENPSLNVRLGDDGRLLIKCRANCSTEAVLTAIGWSLRDIMPPGDTSARKAPRSPKPPQPHSTAEAAAQTLASTGKLVEFYVYQDKDGAPVGLVARVLKKGGKKFMPQAKCSAADTWYTGEGQSLPRPCPPYRLPELMSADSNEPVLVPEGEKKVGLLRRLGFVATCTAMGAGKAKHSDLSPLAGRDVVLLGDHDKPGRDHVRDVAQRARAAGARSVRVAELPGLPPKGDIVDFYESLRATGADDAQVVDAIRAAIAAGTDVGHEDAAESAPADAPEGDSSAESIADQLVELAAEATLFHDPHDEPYATIQVDEHRENWRIGSSHFSHWLCSLYYRRFKKAVPPASLTTAASQLSAMALFDGHRQPVAMRVARIDSTVWLDLCNETWQVVEITPNSWRIVDDSPVRFTRKAGMNALPAPTNGLGNLDQLFDLLRFDDRDLRLLVTAWLVNSIMSGTSYPILALTGEQGSGKTTFCRALQKLVDPHEMEGRSPPRGEEDLAVAAQHAHILCYENMSGVSQQLSDSLCRVATGAGFAARKLFTDADERQLRFCKPIILNGIDDLATRSDLADRVISVQLEPIPGARRQTEADLWAAFAELQPQLLATLLDLVAKVLATGSVDVPLERMAEYSRLGAKVAIALGLPPAAFSDAYRANRDTASRTALESSSIGPVIMRMVSKGRFHGLITGLLRDLQATADPFEQRHADWPTTPRALGGELRRISPNLARIGISVMFHGHRRDGHWVTIEAVAPTHGHNGHNGHEEA